MDVEKILMAADNVTSQSNSLDLNDFYFLCNGKKINNISDVSSLDGIVAVLRLRGGKGGFGSMLRAIGAQIEKTTNREACRDLSGRRLRDINEERRLKNWIAKKEEREKEARERRKKRLQRLCQQPNSEFNDAEYETARSELSENLHESLEKGFNNEKTSCSKSDLKNGEQIKDSVMAVKETLSSECSSNGNFKSSSCKSAEQNGDKPILKTKLESEAGPSGVCIQSTSQSNSKRSVNSNDHSKKRFKGSLMLEYDIDDLSSDSDD